MILGSSIRNWIIWSVVHIADTCQIWRQRWFWPILWLVITVHSQNRNLIREQNWHYYIVVGPKIFLDGGWSQKGCVRTSWQARGYVRSGLGAEGVVMAGCRDRLAVAEVSMMGHRCCPTQPVLDSITSTTSTQHIPCMIGSISDFVSNANKHNTSSFPLFCTHSWCW